jgi:hypothetical protein
MLNAATDACKMIIVTKTAMMGQWRGMRAVPAALGAVALFMRSAPMDSPSSGRCNQPAGCRA